MTKRKDLAQAVYGLMKSGSGRQELAESVAAYLLDNHSSREIGSLLRDIESVQLKQDDILEAQVTSVRPLSPANKQLIENMFDAKKVIIHQTQDPSLIGGVKVRAHDMQVDYSVRTRLQRLKAGA